MPISSRLTRLRGTLALVVAGATAVGIAPAAQAAAPTASIVVADTSLAIGENSLVTFAFSEAVTGFSLADLTVANGTLSALSTADNITYTATFTPSLSVHAASNVITLDNTGVVNGSSSPGTGTTTSNSFAVDTLRPTATVVVADTDLRAGETSLVTVTFSEAVAGFTNADLSIANGTLSTVTSGDGGITWTATFTPTASIIDSSNVITLANTGVQDAAGNAGTGTTGSNGYAVDTVRPGATIVVADTALAAGETSMVTVTFSEAVSGFDNSTLTVANGTLTTVSSVDGGVTWTATFTPTASTDDITNVITLDNTRVQNAAGNRGAGSTDSNNYVIDTMRPTATIVVADSALAIGETSLVTITFLEAVTGLTLADFTVANGTLSSLATVDNITYTATFTPTASINDTSNLITLNNSGVVDAAGNPGSGTTDSNNYALDCTRPTAGIVVADNDLRAGETSLVTITFSEAVIGLTNADLTVANGTLSAVTSGDGGITWTATLTPTASIDDPTNVIALTNTGVTDLAGNAGTGTADSNNYVTNTVPVPPRDDVAPASDAAGPEYSSSPTWSITYTASDTSSGVASVDLYVRAPGETTYVKVATDSSIQDGEFTYTGSVDGTYHFQTIATDRAGNVEAAPATPDVATTLDTLAPTLSPAMGPAPATFHLGEDRAIALRFRVDQTVSATFRITKRGETVRSFGTRTSPAGVLKQLWRGGTDEGPRVRPGRYRVLVVAQDTAGNETRTSVPLRVTR